jgi:hypothetical protein
LSHHVRRTFLLANSPQVLPLGSPRASRPLLVRHHRRCWSRCHAHCASDPTLLWRHRCAPGSRDLPHSRWSQETAHRLRRLRSRIEDEEINITARGESTGKRANSLVQTTASTDSATAEGRNIIEEYKGQESNFQQQLTLQFDFLHPINQAVHRPYNVFGIYIYTLCAHLRESMIF